MILLLILFKLSFQSQAIQFQNWSLEQALSAAKQQNKLVLVQFEGDYDRSNDVANQGLSGNEMSAILSNFICIQVPYNSDEHKLISEKYRFYAKFPCTLFLNEEGDFLDIMLNRSTSSSAIYYKIAANAIANRKIPPLKASENAWNAGTLSQKGLTNFIEALDKYHLNSTEVIDEYVSRLTVAQLSDTSRLLFIIKMSPIVDSKAFRYSRLDGPQFNSAFYSLPLNERIKINTRVIKKSCKKAFVDKDLAYMRIVANFIQSTYDNDYQKGRQKSQEAMLEFYKETDDSSSYIQSATTYYNRYLKNLNVDSLARVETEKFVDLPDGHRMKSTKFYITGNQINKLAWTIYELTNDPEILGRISKWSERLLTYKNPAYHDTHAHILYKLGNIEKALLLQETAVQLQQSKTNLSDPGLKSELEKMKNFTL